MNKITNHFSYYSQLTIQNKFPILPIWLSVIIPPILGFISSISNQQALKTWYASANKSPLTPPNWAFPLAWTIWYLMMGLAYFLVQTKFIKDGSLEKPRKKTLAGWAMIFYWIQLILNLIWSPVFFSAGRVDVGFVIIVILDVLVAITAILFALVDWVAGILMIPYFIWICIASQLNWYIWVNNRIQDGKVIGPL